MKPKNDEPEITEEKKSPEMPVLLPIIKSEREDKTQTTSSPTLPINISPITPMSKFNESLEYVLDSPANTSIEWWKEKYHLSLDDLNILFSSSNWLNDNHMNAAIQILQKQFSKKLNGFHCTTHTPFPMGNYWKYDNKFPLTSSPAVQIHFNGTNHWVTSAKHNGHVYFLDSIFMPMQCNINPNLELQLVAMYGSPGRERDGSQCSKTSTTG